MQAEHFLNINGNKIELGGIQRVISYSEKEVAFALNDRRVTIQGSELKCASVDVDKGLAVLTGTVTSVVYRQGAEIKGFMRKLFK